jgi:DUF1009 family protein
MAATTSDSKADAPAGPIAVIAGSGALPKMVVDALRRSGREVIVLAIAGEADAAPLQEACAYELRLGEIGRMWRLLADHQCREALLIGAVSKRPELKALRPDFGGLLAIPRLVKLMRGGDDRLFSGIAEMFAEKGVTLVSALDAAPDLALPQGVLTKRAPSAEEAEDIARAAEAADALGRLDIGQAAIAVGGRVVAVEGAEGTEGLLLRIGDLRASGRIQRSGGVMVKRLKPGQDRRIDIPTIGPATAGQVRRAGLGGVAASANGTLLAGRVETVAAFDAAGLFLTGIE